MEEEHIHEITEQALKIIALLNYSTFRDKCLEHNIVFDVMINNMEKSNYTSESRFNALMKKITLRGPDAYRKVINILLELSQEILSITFSLQKQL